MPKSRFTIVTLLSFLVTVAVLQWFQMPAYPREVWMVLGLFGFLAFLLEVSARAFQYIGMSQWSGVGALLLCAVAGSVLAFVRVERTTHVSGVQSVESYAIGETVTLHGFVVDEPDTRPMSTKYTIAVDRLETASGVVADVTGRTLVTDYAPWPRHEYGSEVRIIGVLERPTQIEDFHYDRYLSRYGIYSVIYSGQIATLGSGHGHPSFVFLYGLKERFESQLYRLYPEPHASFMAGLLTGSRRGIPEHLLEDFQATGLTHIIAISGYNISIVMGFVSGLLFFLPLRWRLFPSLAAIVFFTLFVGASPSVVRAAIMGGLGLFALRAGRQKHSLIALLIAACAMTAWNPKMLWYDAGFQLSFLAVLGLTLMTPLMEPVFRRLPKYVGEPLQMTIAAQVFAVPLVVLLFGNLPFIAPVANVLVSILVPLGMLFGFAGTAISFLSFPLGLLIAYPGWGMLELVILVAENLSDVPYASIAVPDVGHWVLGIYYILLIGIVFATTHTQTPSAPPCPSAGRSAMRGGDSARL